jgi:Carboxypeptidase regulatory-like domain
VPIIGALLVVCVGATSLAAQVVRGTVTERGSDTRLSGVVLSLVDDSGKVAVAALSDEQGAFEIRAPGPGRFALDAKRIGVRHLRLAAVTIAAGETLRQDVTLEPVPLRLAGVRVTGSSKCVQHPQDNERTAALWEDARAALTATMLTRQNASAADSVFRFMRKLDVITWRVLFEQRTRVPSSIDRPFRSLAAEDLSGNGYVRVNSDGSTDYYAPDADVLLSDPFSADHCFHVERGLAEHARHVGLAFEPIPGRNTPDVRGVLWLDARTAELRTLDFTYSWLPNDEPTGNYGGTVSFFRTLAGRWIVRSWRIRTPEFGLERWLERANGERVPLTPDKTPHVVRIREEGGAVPIGALLTETGRVLGTVVIDSITQRRVAGARVLLAGTTSETVTDANGQFALDFVPPGSYTVVLRHPGLDSLGLEHLAMAVEVGTGTTANLRLQFPSLGELSARLCGGRVKLDREAIIRFIVIEESTGVPLRGAPVVVSRLKTGAPADSAVTIYDGPLDAQGAYLACGTPAGELVRIQARAAVPHWSASAESVAGTIGWAVVRVAADTTGRR